MRKRKRSFNALYLSYSGMVTRCTKDYSIGWKNYGGRGIVVCDEWLNDRESFISWAKENGWNSRRTIERIDVNGNYCPENCTWITKKQQSLNRRNTIKIKYDGEVYSIKEMMKITKLSREIINKRYRVA